MIETPVGCAMKLVDGSLSVIVSLHWKDQLVLLILRDKRRFTWPKQVEFSHPAYRHNPPVEFEIVTTGEEQDFVEWSKELIVDPRVSVVPTSAKDSFGLGLLCNVQPRVG